MKKILITFSILIALSLMAVSFGFGQFGVSPKKMACEKACSTAYDKCMGKIGKDAKDAKKLAAEVACQKAKDDCNSKCN